MADLMQFRFRDPRDYLPRYTVARAQDTAPQSFTNLIDIRAAGQAREQRQTALKAFADEQRRQRELAAQQRAFSQYAGRYPAGSPFNPSRGGGSSGGGYSGPVPSGGYFNLAKQIAGRYGWGSSGQLGALYQIGQHESGWNPNAQNPTSTAYGIGQFLDSTWGTVGGRKTSNPAMQIDYMLKYIANRYGSPANAWNFWQRNHWY